MGGSNVPRDFDERDHRESIAYGNGRHRKRAAMPSR